ncbi:DUF6752 domain-containing protein [Geodermatophilus poikilotrophus]|uniref:DUF6752 domain-containing protein n=1 Tax=Geodermatophilus poikilotrophus TaxID=1333667 RepID=A0A1I0H3R2_9ACTN|nr:DUF6752 domain-containing protein [Geodermatophilus poikilotrophus]SET78200.1 hypothetical protein SAMN04488546_3588 [Geodermatophilus poikilotrophus]
MQYRRVAGAALRRAMPRTFEALQLVRTLSAEVAQVRVELEELRSRTDQLTALVGEGSASLRADLEDARRRGGLADDAIARLFGRLDHLDAGVAELDAGLAESRRLSLRVAQMTDLVFDRLVATPATTTPATTTPATTTPATTTPATTTPATTTPATTEE